MLTPRVHLNGTSKEELKQLWLYVRDAARDLETALRAASPNGRDYYPIGEVAFESACVEHRKRCASVKAIHDEAQAMAEAIDAQPNNRGRDGQ